MPFVKRSLRRDLALANANGAVWAVGNGLVSSTLVVYLALELGAPGAAIGLILAAPRLAGLVRLAAPAMLARWRRRKALCIVLLFASSLVLLAMPFLATPNFWRSPTDAEQTSLAGIGALVGLWCLYHALEYAGVVLLWAWLGDLMPRPVRGRLVGQRESCLVLGRVVGMLASFALVGLWRLLSPEATRWQPLAWSAMIGAGMLLLSTAPLLVMAPRERGRPPRSALPWRAMLASLAYRPYRRLMAFNVGLAMANGVSATAQALYPQRVLGVAYETMLALRSIMWSGQAALAPAAGGWLDRHGGRAMLVAAQLIVATGPLFFWLATPDRWRWIAGAFVAWIAYAATNVALDDLKLTLAPAGVTPTSKAPALAVYYATSDLAAGVMAVFGGYVYDRLTAAGAEPLALYAGLFIAGWLARTVVAILAARIEDRPPPESP